MLIIFDLDDTLIDTSGCITPVKLVDALHRMCAAGLKIEKLHEAEALIKRLDGTRASSRETLKEFLDIHGADPRFLEIGLHEVYETEALEMPVHPMAGAHEVLEELKDFHTLAVVTMGRPTRQLAKMKKAGIDLSLFSRIIAIEDGNKKFHYQTLVQEFNVSPAEVLVCGDRISIDLAPAKELGFKTVHMRQGRGRHSVGRPSDVDFTITQITEIKNICRSLM